MKHKGQIATFALGALLALAGCREAAEPQADDAAAVEPGLCDPGAAETLVGRAAVSDDEARKITGATLVRQIAPGDPVTMDFRQERVTIETDPETGRILRALCG